MPSKYIHVNIARGCLLLEMSDLQMDFKEIRGKVVMVIVNTAPGTADDAYTTELYALEMHVKISSEGDPDYRYLTLIHFNYN